MPSSRNEPCPNPVPRSPARTHPKRFAAAARSGGHLMASVRWRCPGCPSPDRAAGHRKTQRCRPPGSRRARRPSRKRPGATGSRVPAPGPGDRRVRVDRPGPAVSGRSSPGRRSWSPPATRPPADADRRSPLEGPPKAAPAMPAGGSPRPADPRPRPPRQRSTEHASSPDAPTSRTPRTGSPRGPTRPPSTRPSRRPDLRRKSPDPAAYRWHGSPRSATGRDRSPLPPRLRPGRGPRPRGEVSRLPGPSSAGRARPSTD